MSIQVKTMADCQYFTGEEERVLTVRWGMPRTTGCLLLHVTKSPLFPVWETGEFLFTMTLVVERDDTYANLRVADPVDMVLQGVDGASASRFLLKLLSRITQHQRPSCPRWNLKWWISPEQTMQGIYFFSFSKVGPQKYTCSWINICCTLLQSHRVTS